MAGKTAEDMDVCAAADPDAVVVVDEDDNTAVTGGGGTPADAAVAAAGVVTAKAEGEAGEVEEEMVPPSVTASFLKEMIEMGFGEPRCTRALHFTDNASVEAAVQWLVEHGNDADIDEPLLVPKSKPKLTPEEAKRRADELLRKGKEKREREEKELEKLREKERIRFGKEMAAARKLEEEEEIKRNLNERMRQKKADQIAKDKIKQKLEEDRIARRLERGLPAEYTEEELKEIEERKKKEAEEAFKKRNSDNRPVIRSANMAEKLRGLLVTIKKSNADEVSATAFKTLLTLCGNVVKAPENEKFRRINLYNAAIQSRVGKIPEAVAFLEQCGFERTNGEDGEFLKIEETKIDKAPNFRPP